MNKFYSLNGVMTMSITAITNVRVFDGSELSSPTTVTIQDGLIVWPKLETGSIEQTVDGGGHTLIPGLIDAHIHLSEDTGVLKNAAHWGITTLLDMATTDPRLVDSQRNLAGLPDIRSPYHPASAAGGPSVLRMGFPETSIVARPEDAEAFVERQVSFGADYIKLILEDPALNPDTALTPAAAAAIIRAAHRRDLRTFAHAPNVGSFEIGIEAGVDVLTHVPLDGPLPEALAQTMAERGIVSVPTVLMMKGIVDKFKGMNPNLSYFPVDETLRTLIRSGVPIAAGTDANDNPLAPHQLAHGLSLHRELEEYVAAGMTPTQALQSATRTSAALLGFEDRGVIEPGRRADLVLINGDPTKDIRATQNIEAVWIEGVRVR
ncbi:amidohydrolase family protein [Paenibacillus sp. J22TS3]|uniref:amidohydrolase family protein n=1 Tax=Paenibacillus sp. J22TS3 TaxID=2807192 RepID=UPI001BCEEA92|nr:amidohydrolase family protein [Paenibacillus sp. J22TS3]